MVIIIETHKEEDYEKGIKFCTGCIDGCFEWMF